MCFSIVEGEESFRKFSPQVLVKDVYVVSCCIILSIYMGQVCNVVFWKVDQSETIA
jgi:hypothetical protein